MTTIRLQEVTVQSGVRKLVLDSPYHPDLAPRAKSLGGLFSSATKCWYFDPRDAARVRELCLDIYGIDPLAAEPPVLVTVRVALDAAVGQWDQSCWLLGRELCRRAGRDYAVRLGEGVILVSGGFPSSGGSAKNPRLLPRDGTVLEVRDVPKVLVERLWADGWDQQDATLVEDAPPAPVDPLAQIKAAIGRLAAPERAALVDWLNQQEERNALHD